MTTPKTIKKEKLSFDITSLTLEEAVNKLLTLVELYGKNATIDRVSVPYSEASYFAVHVEELETEEEMKLRVAAEAEWHSERWAAHTDQ